MLVNPEIYLEVMNILLQTDVWYDMELSTCIKFSSIYCEYTLGLQIISFKEAATWIPYKRAVSVPAEK